MNRRIGMLQTQELRNMITYRLKEEDRMATVDLMRTLFLIGVFQIYKDF